LKSPQSRDSLRRTLADDSAPEVSFAAAKVLAALQDPAGTSALIEVYDRKRKTGSNVIKKEERSTFEEMRSRRSFPGFRRGQSAMSKSDQPRA
jgi:hypothetical protein